MTRELKMIQHSFGNIKTKSLPNCVAPPRRICEVFAPPSRCEVCYRSQPAARINFSLPYATREETNKAFAARAQGIASNCILHKKCSFGEEVSYLE